MPELADVLAGASGLRLRQGQVAVIAGSTGQYVHIDYAGGRILNAGKFDADTYATGDYVWFLLDDEAGALVLGKQTPSGSHDTAVPPGPSQLVVNAASFATYDQVAAAWTPSALVQSPTQLASWFYAAGAFASFAGWPLGAVEIEVTRTAGGPPEFTTHQNVTGSGTYLSGGDDYMAVPSTPAGVATWVSLPLDWGARLASGAIKGISVGGGTYSGTYSGTGRVRLSPLT